MTINDAPVKQNVKEDKDVNLKIFPWARWHEKDGGGYMCATSTVTRDPESGYVNVGSYRFKLIDETTCVGHMASRGSAPARAIGVMGMRTSSSV